MKPVDSLIKVHDPDNGHIGDCFRACIASLLNRETKSVPHFFDYPVEEGGEKGLEQAKIWLEERGLAFVEIPIRFDLDEKEDTVKHALEYISAYTDNAYYTLTARSKSGNNHFVICHKDKIVHDPSFGNPHGIVEPAINEDGDKHWWFGWLVRL